jgi:hypothetical protein
MACGLRLNRPSILWFDGSQMRQGCLRMDTHGLACSLELSLSDDKNEAVYVIAQWMNGGHHKDE